MTTDFTKCIKYHKNTTENLSEGSSQWIQRFCDAASIRNDEIYVHIKSEMPAMVNQEETVLWHPNCYKSYTSKHNLETNNQFHSESDPTEGLLAQKCDISEYSSKTMRSDCPALDWNLCIFCQQVRYKQDYKLCVDKRW